MIYTHTITRHGLIHSQMEASYRLSSRYPSETASYDTNSSNVSSPKNGDAITQEPRTR